MYTRKQLELKTLKRLKAIASELEIYPSGDKRLKTTWVEAILLHQPQEQPKPAVKPSCATCPFASHISDNRYLCTADPDMVASGGKVVRAHWEVGTDCQAAITALQDAEVEYVQQLEAKHEADFNRSTQKVPTQEPAPVYNLEGFTVHLFPALSLSHRWGWDAEIYHPHKKERYPLGFWYSTAQEAMGAAAEVIRQEVREQATLEALAPVIAQLQKSGISHSEIINGLAELFYRGKSCPDEVVLHLEEASLAFGQGGVS